MFLEKIKYSILKSKQQENYNFHKASALLADYGFNSIRLTDDWNGADFIAVHIDGRSALKIQAKGRMSFSKKYQDKNLYIFFFESDRPYLVSHDDLLKDILSLGKIASINKWPKGDRNWSKIPKAYKKLVENHNLFKDEK